MESNTGDAVREAMLCLRASILQALDVYEEQLRTQALWGLPAPLSPRSGSLARPRSGHRTDEDRKQLEVAGKVTAKQGMATDAEGMTSQTDDLISIPGNCNSSTVVGSEPLSVLHTVATGMIPEGAGDMMLVPTRCYEGETTGRPVVHNSPSACRKSEPLGSLPSLIQEKAPSSQAEDTPPRYTSGPSQLATCLPVLCSDECPKTSCEKKAFSSNGDQRKFSWIPFSKSGTGSGAVTTKRSSMNQPELFEDQDRPTRNTTRKAIKANLIEEEEGRKGRFYRLVMSERFEYAFGFFIFLNAIFLGLHANYRATHMQEEEEAEETGWREIDLAFLIVFCIEVVLRLVGQRCDFFLNPEVRTWNMFDVFVVALPIVEEIIKHTSEGSDSDQASKTSSSLRILRVLRNFRIIRLVRLMRIFQELRFMLTSIFGAVKSLCWACLLLAIIMWIFAIFFIEGSCDYLEDHPEQTEDMQEWYGSLGRTLVTLFMSICGGVDWSDPAFAIENAGIQFLICFIGYIAFTQFAVLNIVTGVFLQQANSNAACDLDNLIHEDTIQKCRLRADIIQLFHEGDEDDSGDLTMEEFDEYLKDSRVQTFFSMLNLDIPGALEFFHVLDEDKNGFVDGCLRLRGSPKSVDMVNTLRLTKLLSEKMDRLLEANSAGSVVNAQKSLTFYGHASSSPRQRDIEPQPLAHEPMLLS